LSPKTLARLEAGTLEEAQVLEAKSHVASCASCRERKDELSLVLAVLGSPGLEAGEPSPAPGTWAAISEELARDADRTSIARVAIGCAYCKGGLVRAESVYCAACLAPHHQDCFEGHGRCAACSSTSLVRAQRAAVPLRKASAPGASPRKLAIALPLVTFGLIGAAALGSRAFPGYFQRQFLALWVDAESKRRTEWESLRIEVENLKVNVKSS
jgi:hypothetical protein